MTTLSQLRKAALGLPEVAEGTHFGMVSFAVRGRGFASVTKDGLVQLRLADAKVDEALAAHPGGERLTRSGTVIGFRMPLSGINGKDLNALVYAAWLHRAPKRLAAALAGAQTAAAEGPAGDLPAGIGRPATRALLGAGIDTPEKAAAHSRAELLALHGVGPKAVRILGEVLEERGLGFRD